MAIGGRRDGRQRPNGFVPKTHERRADMLQGPADRRRRVLVVRRRQAAPASRVPLSVQPVGVVREHNDRRAISPRLFRSDRRQPGRLFPHRRPEPERHVQGVPVQPRLLQRRRRRTGRSSTVAGDDRCRRIINRFLVSTTTVHDDVSVSVAYINIDFALYPTVVFFFFTFSIPSGKQIYCFLPYLYCFMLFLLELFVSLDRANDFENNIKTRERFIVNTSVGKTHLRRHQLTR